MNDLDGLKAQAEIALQQLNPELALKFYERALQQTDSTATDVSILLSLGDIHLQMNHTDQALTYFNQIITNHATSNEAAYAYLYLGQCSCGSDSLSAINKGIKLLTIQLTSIQQQTDSNGGSNGSGSGSGSEISKIKSELSSAYCSVCELYMTDLCYDDNAESECERAGKCSVVYVCMCVCVCVFIFVFTLYIYSTNYYKTVHLKLKKL